MKTDDFAKAVTWELEQFGLTGAVRVEAASRVGAGPLEARLAVLDAPGRHVHIAVDPALEGERLEHAIRGELQRGLRLCPLCQRIGHVEKIRGEGGTHDACAVRCPACGEYEIDQALVKDFRAAWDRLDPDLLPRLAALAESIRAAPRPRRITTDQWQKESGRT